MANLAIASGERGERGERGDGTKDGANDAAPFNLAANLSLDTTQASRNQRAVMAARRARVYLQQRQSPLSRALYPPPGRAFLSCRLIAINQESGRARASPNRA